MQMKWIIILFLSLKTPCNHVHRISCQSHPQSQLVRVYQCFIYNLLNTFPLICTQYSLRWFDIFKTILNHWLLKLFYNRANKWGTVRLWIYLFIIRQAISWKYKASFKYNFEWWMNKTDHNLWKYFMLLLETNQ